jgi:beta-ureidopropionase
MPRPVTIVTVCQARQTGPTPEANRTRVAALIDRAAEFKPDILCLPEGLAAAGTGLKPAEAAEGVHGTTVDLVASRARAMQANIICPIHTRRDGRVYNSAVVIDRQGRVAGIYDKVQPVTGRSDLTEMEEGVTPGREARVIDLDCGRIGIQICFDIGFPETWRSLAEQGAEAVFWPSAYDGGLPLTAFAYLHDYYVISAVRTGHSRIIDPLGNLLADTAPDRDIIAARVDLDYMVCHLDYHYGIRETLERAYGAGVTVRSMQEEGKFLISSNMPDNPLATLAAEYGLGSRRDYHARHEQAYPALREGRAPTPQAPPYLGREPYKAVTAGEWQAIKARQAGAHQAVAGKLSDMDWLHAKADAADRQEAEYLRKAKAEAAVTGKEPFNYAQLITMYDPTSDLGTTVIDPAGTAAALERRYYIDYPRILNLRDFAEAMNIARTSR